MSDDIVAELDHWLPDAERSSQYRGVAQMVRRARDEIVALRDVVERQRFVLSQGHAEVRAEALEEAAEYVEDAGMMLMADRIRAMKDKR
jgi:hypothetical protein